MRLAAHTLNFLRAISVATPLVLATAAAGGCHHAGGNLVTDTPLVTYKAPDIDDITGIDSDSDSTPAPTAAPTYGPAPTTPAPTPAKGGK